MIKKRFVLACTLACVLASLALAQSGGAGGPSFGTTMPEWNPDFMPAAAGARLLRIGAIGYGVSADGTIIGGFGYGLIDAGLLDESPYQRPDPSSSLLAGGVGGLVSGYRLGAGDFAHLDLAAKLGAGGMSSGRLRGWAVLYAEPYAELGLRFAPWMRLTASVGYMFMASMIPGTPFEDLVLRSPTLDVGLAFGSF
jgi:hypothetical protein